MIVTLTPNPSFDRTLDVGALTPGAVHRVTDVTIEAGGKGINVARALGLAGHESTCVFPAGADGPGFLEALGDISNLTARTVAVSGSIRTNIGVIETGGRTTKLNEAGAPLGEQAQADLIAAVVDAAASASWVAICGSYPPGLPADFVVRLRAALPPSVSLAIDASGEPLTYAVTMGCDLIKPNHHELGALLGRRLVTLGDVVAAAKEVHRRGVTNVVVSLGSVGALLVDEHEVLFGSAPTTNVKNTVGAGDAFLAGFLAAGGSGGSALSEALAWGRASVSSASTAFSPATDADRAAVSIGNKVDRSLMMEE